MRPQVRRSPSALWLLCALAAALTLAAPSLAGAEDKQTQTPATADHSPTGAYSLPFAPGEELTYRLSWFGIPAGTAVTTVSEASQHDGHSVWRITSLASSSKFMDMFYKVRDRVVSLFDPELRAPRFYRIDQREGRYRARRIIAFDQEAGQATYIKNDNPPQVKTIPTGAQDALSVLYYFRALKAEPGTTVTIPTLPGKKLHHVKVDVLRRETITLPHLGRVATIVVQPHMDFIGIFRKAGNILVWLTDDERKIPVRLKTTIVYGQVSAVLVEARGCRKAPQKEGEKELPPGEVCKS